MERPDKSWRRNGSLGPNLEVYDDDDDDDNDETSKWADNRQATNFECTLTPFDLNCGFLLTNSDVYYANQDFSETSAADVGDSATHFVDCMINDTSLFLGTICQDLMEARGKDLDATSSEKRKGKEKMKLLSTPHPTLYSVKLNTLKKIVNNFNMMPVVEVVLYGCETWTLTLREEQRLRIFENKVLRKIFEANRDEITGEWRKLHNAELHALYSSPDIIRNIKSRRLRWAGHVASMGESRNAYRMLVGRPEGKRPLGRPRRRWEDNIKMVLREVGYDGRDWINLAQDRDQWRAYVRAAMNLRVP
ncbi:hypothetical protein ANN_22074 [Periplaneta americana]|uniref:Uncharacterized protein n=1 Tax=Periplaneta americana TaxID=6978 RepID=A0ABQ8S806_PERAM|nr:hypothetical protein ANN_22074 [Periplaneta americana]